MFYAFRDEVENVTAEEAKACDLSLGYISVSELDEVVRLFDLPKNGIGTTGYFKSGDCVCVCLEECNIYVRQRAVIVVSTCTKKHLTAVQNTISRLRGGEVSNARLLYTFVDELLANENEVLVDFQKSLAVTEKQILDGRESESLNKTLYCEKQRCIALGAYYSKIREIIEELGDNDFDVFPDDELKYFDLLGARADRLRENSKMLIDGIVHLRDAYQSALDLRLNKTMKLFTIVTVVFAPLGFITGWFGMNFKNLPLINSPYGAGIVIAVSVVVAVGMLVWLKLKR